MSVSIFYVRTYLWMKSEALNQHISFRQNVFLMNNINGMYIVPDVWLCIMHHYEYLLHTLLTCHFTFSLFLMDAKSHDMHFAVSLDSCRQIEI